MDTLQTIDAEFAKWIEEQCERPGFSRRGLAAAIGLTENNISKITTGVRPLKAAELELARRYFQVERIHLSGEMADQALVRVIEAGAYRDHDALEKAVVSNPAISPASFPGCSLFAVVGDGMDALRPRPILTGDYVVCSPYPDAAGVPEDVEDGAVVVVERRASADVGWERSLRQMHFRKGGAAELHFRSRNPSRQTVIDASAEPDGIRLLGIVRFVVGQVSRAS